MVAKKGVAIPLAGWATKFYTDISSVEGYNKLWRERPVGSIANVAIDSMTCTATIVPRYYLPRDTIYIYHSNTSPPCMNVSSEAGDVELAHLDVSSSHHGRDERRRRSLELSGSL